MDFTEFCNKITEIKKYCRKQASCKDCYFSYKIEHADYIYCVFDEVFGDDVDTPQRWSINHLIDHIKEKGDFKIE